MRDFCGDGVRSRVYSPFFTKNLAEALVKPAGRALELVAVGLGQAGGNLALEWHSRGYRALALNTAHTDLSSLSHGDTRRLPREHHLYVGIDGYDGAGADLNYGRDCVAQHATKIREAVRVHADGADAIVLNAGLGGGTGSAISELIGVLEDLGVPMISIVTLPSEYESGIAKVNAVRAVNALVKQRRSGWFFADNARLAQLHHHVSMAHYFEEINRLIVDPIDMMNRLNERDGIAPIRSFDGEDFRTLLLSGGVLSLASAELPKLDVDTVLSAVRDSTQNSGVMPRGFALDQVSYMGLAIEAPEAVLEAAPFSFFEEINEELKEETGGAAIYAGLYVLDDAESPTRLRIVCSSKALPDGLQTVLSDAKREGGALRDKLNQGLAALDLGEIDDLDLFQTTIRGGAPSSSNGVGDRDDDEVGRTGPTSTFPMRSRASG